MAAKTKAKGKARAKKPIVLDPGKTYQTITKNGETYHKDAKGKTVKLTPGHGGLKVHSPYEGQVNAEADLEFGDSIQALKAKRKANVAHDATLDPVFQGFLQKLSGQHDAAVAARDVAVANIGQNAQQIAQTVAAGNVGDVKDAQAIADQGGQRGYEADLARVAGASEGSAVARQGMLGEAARQQGQAAVTSLDNLGANADRELIAQHDKTHQRDLALQDETGALAGQIGAFKVAQTGKHEAQDVQNELAAQAVTAGNAKSLRDYRARIKQIEAQTKINNADNRTAAEIAAGHDAASTANAATGADATKTAAQTAADAAKENAKTSANATITAAKIRASTAKDSSVQPLGRGADGKYRYRRADGQTVVLTEAQHQSWDKTRAKTIGAHRALRKLLSTLGDESKAVHKIARDHHLPLAVAQALLPAARGKKVNDQQYQVLASYFPGALVPPGYITGKAN